MDLALYAPGLGYYVAGARKFGRAGDFVTAPELSPLFGACLARQCASALNALGGGSIVEFGGGSGALAASVLAALSAAECLPRRYAIVELSPELRMRQRARLAAEVPQCLARVEWWTAPPPTPISGVVMANEVLDALPVVRFEQHAGESFELGVASSNASRLTLERRPAPPTLTAAIALRRAASRGEWQLPYQSEINFRLEMWIAGLTEFLHAGVVILADYGYPRAEYYSAERTQGTLQCYFRHRVHADSLWYPGLQDITASVDFSAVAESAHLAGFEVWGYTDQSSYLVSAGLTDLLAALPPESETYYRAAQAVKTLVLPQAMGTRAKFMVLTRGYSGPVLGFTLRDDRHRL